MRVSTEWIFHPVALQTCLDAREMYLLFFNTSFTMSAGGMRRFLRKCGRHDAASEVMQCQRRRAISRYGIIWAALGLRTVVRVRVQVRVC